MDAMSPMKRLADFQRNTAFVAFVCVVAAYALLLMMERFRTVLTPLIWATFFALPLNRAVTQLQKLAMSSASCLSQRCCLEGRTDTTRGRTNSLLPIPLEQTEVPMDFRYVEGINEVRVAASSANRLMLEKAQNPFAYWTVCTRCPMPVWFRSRFLSCCQRRIRVLRVDPPPDGSQLDSHANRLRPEDHFYLGAIERDDAGHEIKMKLYLDHNSMRYPAIQEADVAGHRGQVTGLLALEQASTISWFFSVVIVFVAVVFVINGVVTIVYFGIQSFQEEIPDYVEGTNELLVWMREFTRRFIPDETWDKIQAQAIQMLSDNLAGFATSCLEGMFGFCEQLVFFTIYLLFWLCEPIPMDDTVTDMLRKYLFLKTFVCILFAGMISLMLFLLNCKMWAVFFPLTFMLNYLPEIGPILIGALCVPAVLLDGSLDLEVRGRNTLIAITVGVLAKFLTANVIEMRLYTQSGGEFMRMHPVVLMAMMFVFYEILGLTGLFMAVPIVAFVKCCLVTADMPANLLDPVLVAIEGDRMAPHRNFVDRIAIKHARRTNHLPSEDHGFSMQSFGPQEDPTRSPLNV